MRIVEGKKINESSLKTLSEVRQAAWDLANGMGVIDDFKNEVDSLLMALNGYFEAIEKGDEKKARSYYNSFVIKHMGSLQKRLK